MNSGKSSTSQFSHYRGRWRVAISILIFALAYASAYFVVRDHGFWVILAWVFVTVCLLGLLVLAVELALRRLRTAGPGSGKAE
jgi:hypothetical protein